jgi:hypothetical protein
LRPGNAGGAKGPDFWCAFEDGEVKVIGDEPGNTDNDPDPSEKGDPPVCTENLIRVDGVMELPKLAE